VIPFATPKKQGFPGDGLEAPAFVSRHFWPFMQEKSRHGIALKVNKRK
jgi:hypothetical protein